LDDFCGRFAVEASNTWWCRRSSLARKGTQEMNTGKTPEALDAIQAVDFSSVFMEIISDLAFGFDHPDFHA
jgi:hypothetical protein